MTYNAAWLQYATDAMARDEISIAIQVNGKLRDRVSIPTSSDDDALVTAALNSTKVVHEVAGRQSLDVFVVPKKLVNIVI